MVRHVLVALSLALLASCAQTQATNADGAPATAPAAPKVEVSRSEELLNKLVGRWVLTGVIAGQNTVHDVDAAWVLQRNYVRINEVSRERGENGQPAYEATIYVGWLKDHYVCIWLDNTEVASGEVTCNAADSADSIPFEFRDAQGSLIFSNTFAYDRANDAWQWRMSNIHDGAPELFGDVTLRRR